MPETLNWKFVCCLLCAVGFFKSMRPSEPFLTNYLIGPWVNLTMDQVVTEVYPVATYTSLVALFIVLIVTDFLRYKPVIIFEALTFLITYVLLIKGRSLEMMQLVEVLYAVSISCEVAYYTYMYAKVTDEHYQKVTSYARAAVLAGIFLGGVVGQVLVLTKTLDYSQLNYISLVNACVMLLLSLFLPKVPFSIYFHQEVREMSTLATPATPISRQDLSVRRSRSPINERENRSYFANTGRMLRIGFWTLWLDFKQSYSIPSVLKWSIWWAFGTCLNTQVMNYIQPLWEEIYPTADENVTIYNGAVESASTLLGAVAALAVGFTVINWSLFGELAMFAVSVLDAACLCLLALADDIWVAYGSYITFRVAYQLLITIASFQVAKDLKPDTYSLIFGCNTFMALVIQTLLVFIVVDKAGLALVPRSQFYVYALYSLVLGIIFFITGIITCIRYRTQRTAG